MENFSLWNLSQHGRSRKVSLFATSLGLQQINRGTRVMLEEMLKDLGFAGVDIDDWAVSHLATDYLSDDRDSDDWRDRWLDTWEIEVHLKESAEFPERHFRTATMASDHTWEGEEPAPTGAVVVADFDDDNSLARMKAAMELLNGVREAAKLERPLTQDFKIPERLAMDISKAASERSAEDGAITVETGHTRERQLMIHVPANKAFFEKGARFALLIEQLVEQLGGTTYWRDTAIRGSHG